MPSRSEDGLHLARDVAVFAADQAVAVLDDAHPRAEAAEHLRELEPDVAAADDDQVLGQHVELHHRRVGEHRHVGQAGPVGQRGTAAHVDEDAWRREHPIPHGDRARPGEAGVAPDQLEPGGAAQPARQAVDRLGDDAILARLHRLQVDTHRAVDEHAVVGGPARHVGGAGAGDHRLGGDAAVVDAGTAEMLALDQGGLHAGRGEAGGQEGAGLAAADDDGVVGVGHGFAPGRSTPGNAGASQRALTVDVIDSTTLVAMANCCSRLSM